MADVKYIYFYFSGSRERPLYIGQTVNVVGRFRQHIHENKLFVLTDKIYYTAVPEIFSKDQVDLWESYFISFMHPIISETRRKYFVASPDSWDASAILYEAVKDSGNIKNFLEEYCDVIHVKDGVIDIG